MNATPQIKVTLGEDVNSNLLVYVGKKVKLVIILTDAYNDKYQAELTLGRNWSLRNFAEAIYGILTICKTQPTAVFVKEMKFLEANVNVN